jgi:CheY-like chemotaxis protein
MMSSPKHELRTLILTASQRSSVVRKKRRKIDILIVENDPELRHELALSLDDHDFRLEVASDGQEALEHLRHSCHPQLVLTNLSMPVMDGGDLLANMERHPDWCRIPVIVMTGTADGILAEALRMGGIRVLQKPFGVEELLDSIHEMWLSAPADRATARGAPRR